MTFFSKYTHVSQDLSKVVFPSYSWPLSGIANELSGNDTQQLHLRSEEARSVTRVWESLPERNKTPQKLNTYPWWPRKSLDSNPLPPETSPLFAFLYDVICLPLARLEHTFSVWALAWLNLLRLLTGPWNVFYSVVLGRFKRKIWTASLWPHTDFNSFGQLQLNIIGNSLHGSWATCDPQILFSSL